MIIFLITTGLSFWIIIISWLIKEFIMLFLSLKYTTHDFRYFIWYLKDKKFREIFKKANKGENLFFYKLRWAINHRRHLYNG